MSGDIDAEPRSADAAASPASGDGWDAETVASAALPLLAFAVPVAGYATGVVEPPRGPMSVPGLPLAVGFLASALAVESRYGLPLGLTATVSALVGFAAYGHFVSYGPGFTLRGFLTFLDVGGALTLGVLAGLVAPFGYTAAGVLRWGVGELRAAIADDGRT